MMILALAIFLLWATRTEVFCKEDLSELAPIHTLMDYKRLCKRMLESHDNIKDALIISSSARLLAFNGTDDATDMDEARLAELMEDLLFTMNSKRRYEDLFGVLQYVHVRHRDTDLVLVPFEGDKVVCLVLRGGEDDLPALLAKVREALVSIYKLA